MYGIVMILKGGKKKKKKKSSKECYYSIKVFEICNPKT